MASGRDKSLLAVAVTRANMREKARQLAEIQETDAGDFAESTAVLKASARWLDEAEDGASFRREIPQIQHPGGGRGKQHEEPGGQQGAPPVAADQHLLGYGG